MSPQDQIMKKVWNIYQKYDFLEMNENDLKRIFDMELTKTLSFVKQNPQKKIEVVLLKNMEEHFQSILVKRIRKNKLDFISPYIEKELRSCTDNKEISSFLESFFRLFTLANISVPESISSLLVQNEKIKKYLQTSNESNRFPLLFQFFHQVSISSPKEERFRTLIGKSQQGDLESQNILVEENLKLVYFIVHKNYSKSYAGLEKKDLIQTGVLGLMKAIQKFDLSKENSFSTYACFWIEQAIRRFIVDNGSILSASWRSKEYTYTLHQKIEEFLQKNHRTPSIEELSSLLKVSPKKIRETLSLKQYPFSLEYPVFDGKEESKYMNFLEDPKENVENEVEEKDFQEKFSILLTHSNLTEVELIILIMRYNLDDNGYRTLDEVGKLLGYSRENIRKIEAKALDKLYHSSYLTFLSEYIDPNWIKTPALKAIDSVEKENHMKLETLFSKIDQLQKGEDDLFGFYQKFSAPKEIVDQAIKDVLTETEITLIQKKYIERKKMTKNEKDLLLGRVVPKIKKYIKNMP